MKTDRDSSTDFDRYIQSVIRKQAARITKAVQLPRTEREDLEQDLRLHLMERRGAYDRRRGSWNTFARTVIERKAACLLQAARAQNRSRSREAWSLDEDAPSGDGARGQFLDQDAYLLRTARISRVSDELNDLRIDVDRVVEKLKPEHRELARSLMAERVAEVSRRTGVSRSTLYEHIKQIRKVFRDEGLEDYLTQPRTLLRSTQ